MTAPQGKFQYPGITTILSAEMNFATGATPSTCRITTPTIPEGLQGTGTLTISYSGVSISFRDCAVKSARARGGRGGFEWAIQIVDRRWRWKFGQISGHYNQRNSLDKIIAATKKSTRDLAKLLLAEMGESGDDGGALKEDWPEVRWNNTNPAAELERLAHDYGCRIVLTLDDKVKIKKHGNGAAMPTAPAMNLAGGVVGKARADAGCVVFGATMIQQKLKLQAVGLDVDDDVKPIGRLTYTPASGWTNEMPITWSKLKTQHEELATSNRALFDKYMELAAKSVFRWYRVVGDVDGELLAPVLGAFNAITSILPLSDKKLSTEKVGGEVRPAGATVEGVHWEGGEDLKNVDGVYAGDFRIDVRAGIVQFAKPVIAFDDSGKRIAADLYLETSHPFRNKDTHDINRFSFSKLYPDGVNKKRCEVLRDPDGKRGRKIIAEYIGRVRSPVFDKDNKSNLIREATRIIDAAGANHKIQNPGEVTLAGFQRVELDGAIHQVSWSTGRSGAFTRVSRFTEHSLALTPHKKRVERKAEKAAVERLHDDVDLLKRISGGR